MTTTDAVEAAMRADLAARDDSCVGTFFYTDEQACAMYRASRMTVRGAVQRLVSDGMLRSDQGVGRTILRRHPRLTAPPPALDPADMTDGELFDFAERALREIRRRWGNRRAL